MGPYGGAGSGEVARWPTRFCVRLTSGKWVLVFFSSGAHPNQAPDCAADAWHQPHTSISHCGAQWGVGGDVVCFLRECKKNTKIQHASCSPASCTRPASSPQRDSTHNIPISNISKHASAGAEPFTWGGMGFPPSWFRATQLRLSALCYR